MKIKSGKKEPEFTPVEITITFESELEGRIIRNLIGSMSYVNFEKASSFNPTDSERVIGRDFHAYLWNALRNEFGNQIV